MLPAKNRLNLAFYRTHGSDHIKGELLDIYMEDASVFKAAVKVNKKVAAKAVDRNRIRRIVLEALVPYTNNLAKTLVVVIKKNFATYKTQKVSEELKKLLND